MDTRDKATSLRGARAGGRGAPADGKAAPVTRRYGATFRFRYNMKCYTFLTLGEAALMRRRLGLRLFPDEELGF